MEIKIVKDNISMNEVAKLASDGFGDMVKAVVDIEKEIMAIGGELHADAAQLLGEKEGSLGQNVWGFNIYPGESRKDWVVFDSMVNIKPLSNNRSLYIESEDIRKKIKEIVDKLVS